MNRYLFDSSALLTLRDEEAGADQVAGLLYQAQQQEAQCFGCFISLMEVFYRVWKDEDEKAGRLAYEQCQSLPLEWIHESKSLLEKAAEIKATKSLSLADAWIVASAILEGAVLVHKDPEFKEIKCEQLVLPYKAKKYQ
ncbi:MAG: PIN domain-containing protein [SAR324 cluster bacterium]|nr:PIN domain-containing protein [SAR324 cluster bacterium]